MRKAINSEQALDWAVGAEFQGKTKTLADRPWAKTIRLISSADNDTVLKISPGVKADDLKLSEQVHRFFPDLVPKLLDSDLEKGLFHFEAFEGKVLKEKPDEDGWKEILKNYAHIQTEARAKFTDQEAFETKSAKAVLNKFLAFLHSDRDYEAGLQMYLSDFVGREDAMHYFKIFMAVYNPLLDYIQIAEDIPKTINHCDLRHRNIAQNADGKFIIFDWDEAVWGPPGLSLHNLFSGTSRAYRALVTKDKNSKYHDRDLFILNFYADALSPSPDFKKSDLLKALPASIAWGQLLYITSFARHKIDSRSLKSTISANIRKRLSDLLNLCELIVNKNNRAADALIDAYWQTGRLDRAKELTAISKSDRMEKLMSRESKRKDVVFARSAPDDIFPYMDLRKKAPFQNELTVQDKTLACQLYQKHGGLMLKNAISVDLIEKCKSAFFDHYDRYFVEKKHKDALRVGDKRYMISVDLNSEFANRELVAPPKVYPILKSLLGSQLILGSATIVASLPGAEAQRLHKDNSPLFRGYDAMGLPPFLVSVIIPLIRLDEKTGSTEIVKGSHLKSSTESAQMPLQVTDVDVGSCYFMDARLSHRGMANKSDQVRPILCMIYQRPWYRDFQNFKKQDPLMISRATARTLPTQERKLVEWAV